MRALDDELRVELHGLVDDRGVDGFVMADARVGRNPHGLSALRQFLDSPELELVHLPDELPNFVRHDERLAEKACGRIAQH